MAKRGGPRKGGAARRGGARKGASLEVDDTATLGSAEPMSLETGLVFVTFAALILGLILAQIDLSSTYGAGWLF